MVMDGYTDVGEDGDGWVVSLLECMQGLLEDPLLGPLVCELTVCLRGRGLPFCPNKEGVLLCGLYCALSAARR